MNAAVQRIDPGAMRRTLGRFTTAWHFAGRPPREASDLFEQVIAQSWGW